METLEQKIKALEDQLASSTSPAVQKTIEAEIQKLKQQRKAEQGDEVSRALVLMKDVLEATRRNAPVSSTPGIVDKAEIEKIVKQTIYNDKITKDDLDDELKNYLMSTVKVQVDLKTPEVTGATGGKVSAEDYERPLFQKILSDLIAMNNVYLYGGAGTGKTFIAEMIADFMGWDFVLLSCNQFTSQLDILGGQTIDGYQVGKLEMAWGNLDANGNPSPKKGAVLCLDELPKIDPNTAGILNAALANVKNYKKGGPGNGAPYIFNGKNEKIYKGNLLIVGTGNVKLNEMSTEYEANFKQDLSLQDRFAGSTYEILADYEFEVNKFKNFLFIWIPMIKVREKIIEMKWTGQAFVSLRILFNLRDTYVTYRNIKDGIINKNDNEIVEKIKNPKTLKQGVDSFLNLFKQDQIDQLKDAMGYDNFIKVIIEKDSKPLNDLTTGSEIKDADKMVKEYKNKMKNKIA